MYSCWVLLSSIEYFSINTNLPPTAYVKMIDVWLLFNLLKPFVDIIVQTYVETMREHPDEKEGEADRPRSAWVSPGEGKVKSESLEAVRYEVGVVVVNDPEIIH